MNQLVGVATTFLIGVVLSRLLGPAQFGLIAMVTTVTQFGAVFAQAGIGNAIIQKESLTQRDSSTVFWVNCLTGWLVASGVVALASPVASFYDQPVLFGVTLWVAVTFVVNALGTVQQNLLHRALNFRRLFFINTSATLTAGMLGIALALHNWGVWSLVAKLVAESVVRILLLWVFSSWRPSFVFDGSSLRYALGFGLPVLGTQSINYWARNLDSLAIGRVWGDVALGNYDKAYSLMLLPMRQITAVIGRVMFPSLASIQNDKQRVKSIFLKTLGSAGLIGFPVSVGIFVLAEPVVLTLYGPKWEGSIELLRILSLLGINQSVGALNGLIYQSQNATLLQFKWGLVVHSLCVLSILLGLPYGASGVALAYTVTSLLITIPNWMILRWVIPIQVWEILMVCAVPFFGAVAMGAVVAALDYYVLHDAQAGVRLASGTLVGVFTFVLLMSITRPMAWRESKKLLLGRMRRSKEGKSS